MFHSWGCNQNTNNFIYCLVAMQFIVSAPSFWGPPQIQNNTSNTCCASIIRVAQAALSIMTKLRYCDITRGSDIATEQERSLAMSTRPRLGLSHAIRKDKLVLLLHFRQVDIIPNLVEMSLSPWL